MILIITLDSIYLKPNDDVAKRSSEGVSQACADDSFAYEIWDRPNIQRVMFNKLWCNSVDLCTIVQQSYAALPIDLYSGHILNCVPSGKGVGIQEGSLHLVFYTWGILYWGTFGMVTFPWGAQTPFFGAVPSPLFKGKSALDPTTSGQLQMKWSGLPQW